MPEESHPVVILRDIIDALGKASACCTQMVHSHGSPMFIPLRQALELTKEGLTKEALRQYDKPVFVRPL